MQQNLPIPNKQADVPSSLRAADVGTPSQTVQSDSRQGDSLAEMAQRDLDAALQLLAYRAQYITGASGAAIALRRDGRNDMLCRASSGTSAPELGALLSTEFGLSGESVRTRKLLHCDDAERDARVNRVACRQLGIASVVVMPVVNDDEVLGVFELFSAKANAFGEHDLSAVQRLSEMVETAVRLARAATVSPDQFQLPELPVPAPASVVVGENAQADATEEILDEEIFSDSGVAVTGEGVTAPAAESLKDEIIEVAASTAAQVAQAAAVSASATANLSTQPGVVPAPPVAVPPAKKLFWSAEPTTEPAAEKSPATDQSHVPPVLRGLRKCEACGFPVSAGRVLCVECEEKKWRGQLRRR